MQNLMPGAWTQSNTPSMSGSGADQAQNRCVYAFRYSCPCAHVDTHVHAHVHAHVPLVSMRMYAHAHACAPFSHACTHVGTHVCAHPAQAHVDQTITAGSHNWARLPSHSAHTRPACLSVYMSVQHGPRPARNLGPYCAVYMRCGPNCCDIPLTAALLH